MLVRFAIPVSNVVSLLGLGFTKIEIWHSGDQGSSFQEITSSTPQPAVLYSTPANTMFEMGGHQLRVSINGGAEQTINFDSLLKFWTPAQVASQINITVAGLATVVGNSVVLTSTGTGRGTSVLITYNDADDLGFFSGQIVYGTDARITLVSTTFIYSYVDLAGQPDDFYEWRFSANGVNPISPYSNQIQGIAAPVSPVALSIATATFLDLTGTPQQRSIIIVSDVSPTEVGGYVVDGGGGPLIVKSDELGFLQVPLVQGIKVRVAIEGTTFVREITVPTTPTFDLLTALAAAPDPFTVQTTPPFLIRRSI